VLYANLEAETFDHGSLLGPLVLAPRV